jgi:hypothetical protein
VAEKVHANFAKNIPEFRKGVRRIRSKVGSYDAYELALRNRRRRGTDKGDLSIWGTRGVFFPPRDGEKPGVKLLHFSRLHWRPS